MNRHPALWLTVFLAAFYIILGNGRTTSGDEEAMLQVTRALAEQGRLDLPPGILPPVEMVPISSTDTEIPYTRLGLGGHTYSKYGLGQSLAALPLYLLGMAWRAVAGADHAPRFAALLLNGLVTASTAGLLLILASDLAFPRQTALLLSLAFALCSPAWPYTHTFFSEPLVTLCLIGAAVTAVRFAKRGQTRWLALTGGALGLALLTRINAVAALPAFCLYLALNWPARRTLLSRLGQPAAGLLAFSLGVGLMVLYNLVRFGSPFDFGYHTNNWQSPFLVGLYGLTLSPGKGLLWYTPPVLLGLIGLRFFARQCRSEALLCGAVLAGYLLVHSFYTYWEGGWCWGPRLILPALPFAILPAGSLLTPQKTRRQATELLIAIILVLGLLVQIPAVGSNYAHPLQRAFAAAPEKFQSQVLYNPAHSPLRSQWISFLEVTANLRSAQSRARVAHVLATARPDDTLLLANSPAEALRLERQTILAFNFPDLWLVSEAWLDQDVAP